MLSLMRIIIALLSLLLFACAPAHREPEYYDLTIINKCMGGSNTVYVYANGTMIGTATGTKVFKHLEAGNYALKAEGTGESGKTFTRNVSLEQDTVWTLCL